jgi:hypothetical protein
MEWIVYALSCPRTKTVRYVGWTKKSAHARLKQHISDALSHRRANHRRTWIRSLLSAGQQPLAEVLESGTGDGWAEAERRWITHYRASGAQLVNATDGGEGWPTGWGSPEQRRAAAIERFDRKTPEQRSESARKRWARQTPEQRSEIIKKGYVTNPARRDAIARVYMNLSPAQRAAAITASKQAKATRSPEEMEATWKKASVAHKAAAARKTAEERSAIAKQTYDNRTPEQRSAFARAGSKAGNEAQTFELRSAAAKKRRALRAS